MMTRNKILTTVIAMVSLASVISAQKVWYVDSRYILEQLPEYKQAQDQLNEQVKTWEEEIKVEEENLEQLHLKLENQRVLLTEGQLDTKQKEIDEASAKLKELKTKRFGINGDVIRTRQNLVRPIQDQVWNAVETVAKKRSIGIVLDKGGNGLSIIYSDPKYDLSQKVVDELKKTGE